MFIWRIAFAFSVHRAVNAALSANRMRAFDRHDRNQINFVSRFGIFIAAAKPAKPPPTTAIFNAFEAILLCLI